MSPNIRWIYNAFSFPCLEKVKSSHCEVMALMRMEMNNEMFVVRIFTRSCIFVRAQNLVVLGQVVIVLTHQTFELKLFRVSDLAVTRVWDTGMAIGQSRAIESAFGIGSFAICWSLRVESVQAKEHVHDCDRSQLMVLISGEISNLHRKRRKAKL